jgi:DNA-binding response OmpR family regulator
MTGDRKVLIIEDHNDVADLEKLMCQLEGYEVRVARTGDEGWEVMEDFKPDLILLDLMLPGTLTGHDVLRKLRDAPGETKPKVIVVSALMNANTISKVLEPGKVETMEKPFTINALATRMRTLLAN